MNNSLKVGIYVRVSTEDQKEFGYSIPQQIDLLTNLANKNNWIIYKIYNDAGISGKNTERPMLKQLLDDIKNQKINKVLITKLDRLSRNVVDTATLLNIFNNFNCELIDSTGRKIESDNPSDWLFTIIQSAFGQYERKAIINRIKDGFAGKAKMGKTLCSSTPPYGYNREKGSNELIVNEDEATIVKRVYSMYLDGNSFSDIARALNASKVLTKRSKIGNKITKWTSKTIKLILSNSTYIGKIRYHLNREDYQEYNGNHSPLIDDETYKLVQEKHLKNNLKLRTNKPKDDVYFCGTIVCGCCNTLLTTQRTKRNNKIYYGYRCRNRELGMCEGSGVSHIKMEKAFLKYLKTISGFDVIDSFDICLDNKENLEINDLKKNIRKNKVKEEEIIQLFMDNSISNVQMQFMIKEINLKNKVMSERLKRLENIKRINHQNVENILINLSDHFEMLTNFERRDFLNQFVEYIIIKNDEKNKMNGCPIMIEVKLYD
ncbi:MAG: recombinase family protein [Bacilli bacterium]|nr:recombinase family protein [Bacilli bacterium]MDD4547422.1 recombinase family protein [Bacilli bacterium]